MTLRLNKLSGLPMHDDGQQWRVLGALPTTKPSTLPMFASKFPVVPEAQWVEGNVDMSQVTVYDQLSHGSCTGNGAVAAFTFSWLMSGQTPHVFSPTSVYARINGGRDQGAVVHDALLALKQYGTCFFDQFDETKIYANQFTPDIIKTAARFRVSEAYTIKSWAELGSALSLGLVVVSGLAVGNNFSNLDNNGVCPLPDQVIGGHCLAHYGLKKVNGVYVARTRNSWGTVWGLSGDCYIQQDAWAPAFGFPFDAFAIGGVVADPLDGNDPPVVIG